MRKGGFMKAFVRRSVALCLCESLIILPGTAANSGPSPAAVVQNESLRAELRKSYLELFEQASTFKCTAAELQQQREALDKGKDSCVKRFKDRAKRRGKEAEQARSTLKEQQATISDEQRSQTHCKI